MSDYKLLTHEFEPVYDRQSRILILGTFPSVKSRENNFYYGHPRNRFWKVLSSITDASLPVSIDEKRNLLFTHNIAIWDVIRQCEIIGSSDSRIKNVIPVNLSAILDECEIQRIYGNGTKACQLYNKYLLEAVKIPIIALPSTSPANAAYSFEKLLSRWTELLDL